MVAFQGSHDLPNWILDFDFPLIPYAPVLLTKVHQGFYLGWRNINEKVREMVDTAFSKYCKDCTDLQVIGHSYGAALSVFQALDFVQTPPAAVGSRSIAVDLTNFGCPRVGDPAFAEYLGNSGLRTYFRFTHLEDPVPHVPLESMGFRHGALEIYNYVWNGTDVKVCDGSGEDNSCSNSNLFLNPAAHLLYLSLDGHFGPHVCKHW